MSEEHPRHGGEASILAAAWASLRKLQAHFVLSTLLVIAVLEEHVHELSLFIHSHSSCTEKMKRNVGTIEGFLPSGNFIH